MKKKKKITVNLLGNGIVLQNARRRHRVVTMSVQSVETSCNLCVVSGLLTSDGETESVSSTRVRADATLERNVGAHLISCFVFNRVVLQFFRDGKDLHLTELVHAHLRVKAELGADLLGILGSKSVELAGQPNL